jgi:hypothetical protein
MIITALVAKAQFNTLKIVHSEQLRGNAVVRKPQRAHSWVAMAYAPRIPKHCNMTVAIADICDDGRTIVLAAAGNLARARTCKIDCFKVGALDVRLSPNSGAKRNVQ